MLATLRQRLDNWPLIFVFGALYFSSQILIGVIVHPLGPDMLGVQTALSADAVRAIFSHWDATGLIDVYAAHFRYDMIHPLWYSVFLAALLAKGFNANRVPDSRNLLLLLPFVAGGCDVVENIVHLSFIADRANITDTAVLVGNGAAISKWILAIGSVIAVGFLAVKSRQRPA